MVRLTVTGGGHCCQPDHKQMWKFWPFPIGMWLFDAQNTIHFIVSIITVPTLKKTKKEKVKVSELFPPKKVPVGK